MSPALRFSVIIPLEFHRGQAVRCVRGWAKDQQFPRDQFEIIVASPVDHPEAELDEIRALLAPQDRMVSLNRHHDMDLCAKATEMASGEMLFFTESHCLPEPGTLAAADAVTRENPQWAGFSGWSLPITGNFLSEIEAQWYGRDIEFGLGEHPWRKVLDQCFVVHRALYFQAGGFDPAFGHFAEWLLAARFSALGLEIGSAPAVRIHHLYIGDFGVWHRFTADFIRGQIAYLASTPPDPLATMFDEVPEWSHRHMQRRSVARRVCRMLLHDLRNSSGSLSTLRQWHWRLLRSWCLRAAAGHAGLQMDAQRRLLATRAALQMDLVTRNRTRAEMHLARCCDAIAVVERARFLRTWARNLEHHEANHLALDDARCIGLGPTVTAGSDAVRWSEPVAYVELPLAAGRWVITISTLVPLLVDGVPRACFYLDERPMPDEGVCIRGNLVELRVDVDGPPSPPRVGWVCRGETGLPVVGLDWAREHRAAVPERALMPLAAAVARS